MNSLYYLAMSQASVGRYQSITDHHGYAHSVATFDRWFPYEIYSANGPLQKPGYNLRDVLSVMDASKSNTTDRSIMPIPPPNLF